MGLKCPQGAVLCMTHASRSGVKAGQNNQVIEIKAITWKEAPSRRLERRRRRGKRRHVASSVEQSILGRVSTSAQRLSSPLTLFPMASSSFCSSLSFLFHLRRLSSPLLLFHFIPLHLVAVLVTSSFFSHGVRTYVCTYTA